MNEEEKKIEQERMETANILGVSSSVTPAMLDEPNYGTTIEDIEHLFKHVTAVPTHAPRKWSDQFVLYDDGTQKRYYAWINNSWQKVFDSVEYTDLTDGGDSTLHYHSADAFDLFGKYFHFMSFESLDGFAPTVDAGASIDVYPPGVRLQTGATSLRHCFMYNNGIFRNLIASGKVITAEWTTLYWGDTTDQLAFLTISTSLTDPPVEEHNSFGFRISSGASIFATNGNGSNSTVTDTTDDVSTGPFIRLKAVYTVGTNIKFYVNDVLRVTHTTNLPSNGDNRVILYLKTEAATNKELHLGRILIQRTY